jgi:two-component system cell cycle response regulator CtrA
MTNIARVRVGRIAVQDSDGISVCWKESSRSHKSEGVMRVLLIEDDIATVQSVLLLLKAAGSDADAAMVGHEGIERGKSGGYDVILLDLNLPDMSGFDVLRALRIGKVQTPVLIVSAIDDVREKARALELGADDYMTKPFHKDELIARIAAVVRRCQGRAPSVVRIGDLVVNVDDKRVELDGVRLHLTVKEYEILALLAVRKGTTLTKEMLLAHLYGGMDEPCLKIIDVFLCKLRKKLAAASNGRNYIETIWGRGYVLKDPIEQPSAGYEPLTSRRSSLPAL